MSVYMLKNKRNDKCKKEKRLSSVKLLSTKKVYTNENLTYRNQKIFTTELKFKKQQNWKFLWTING